MIAPAAPRSAVLVTRSAAETRALGARLAAAARAGDRLALIGRLGAGKTQLAKGFAQGLGVTAVVNSPSFTLMAEYDGRLPLFHLDLYRLAGGDDVLAAGLYDERQAEGVTLIEWAERLAAGLDRERLEVHLEPGAGDDERRIEVVSPSARYAAYLEAASDWRPA
jgi:tRNA threonylcarbamoyladenosine biosynthesis protein TsaE